MDLKSRYKNLAERGKAYKEHIEIIVAILVLASIFSVGLGIGLLIKPNKSAPIIIDKNIKVGLPAQTDISERQTGFTQRQSNAGNFVASINGKSYYPKDCPSSKRIKEENKIWFNSAKEAEIQGYKPAQNCP